MVTAVAGTVARFFCIMPPLNHIPVQNESSRDGPRFGVCGLPFPGGPLHFLRIAISGGRMRKTSLFTIFLIVFIDLVGFGIVLWIVYAMIFAYR